MQKFYGSPYPITKHSLGFFRVQEGIDLLKADLLILLLTNPGERVMLPHYGTPLRKLIFEPNDNLLKRQAKEMVINAINAWEPRIVVDEIEIGYIDENDLNIDDNLQDIDHILNIRIKFFDPNNITNVQALQLEVPLSSIESSAPLSGIRKEQKDLE